MSPPRVALARPLGAGRGAGVAASLGLLLLWWLAAEIRVGGRALLASPWATLRALPPGAGELLVDLGATLGRAGLGLVAGLLLGLLLGVAAAALHRRLPLVEGLLDGARSVPPVILLPLFLLAFGYNEGARIVTVAAGCSWSIALAVVTAARAPRSARRELLDLAGASRLQALCWTQPFEALAELVVGIRNAASTAVVVAVVSEMLAGADHGIGSRVVMAQVAGDTVGVTTGILAIGVAGYLINRGLRGLEEWGRGLLS